MPAVNTAYRSGRTLGDETHRCVRRQLRASGPANAEGKNMAEQSHRDDLLTPAEVAALFRVNPKTVTRWARAGKITAIRTLGGHRRFRSSEIKRCLEQMEHETA